MQSKTETMLLLARELNAPYISERSFKLLEGVLLDHRLLMSFQLRALGKEPRSTLEHVCDALDAPAAFRRMIESHFHEADNIHLGYEEDSVGFVYKLYLEFARRFRRSLAEPGESAPALLHLAFKWDPQDGGLRTVARYTCRPRLTPDDMQDRLQKLYGGLADRLPCRFATSLVRRACQRMPRDDLFFLEVEEEGNPRRSFDLCVYDAGFSMQELEPEFAAVAEYFRIPGSRFRQAFEPAWREKMGHLSGGVGRTGTEFCTFYYGARRHLPAPPPQAGKGP